MCLHTRHLIGARKQVDDDIRVPCRDLKLALHAWAMSPSTLVGFFPRLHTPAPTAAQSRDDTSPNSGNEALSPATNAAAAAAGLRFEYHSWWYVWWYGRYSMVLTKAAILHRKYLAIYSAEAPATAEAAALAHTHREVGNTRVNQGSGTNSGGAHAPLQALPSGVRE